MRVFCGRVYPRVRARLCVCERVRVCARPRVGVPGFSPVRVRVRACVCVCRFLRDGIHLNKSGNDLFFLNLLTCIKY